MIALGREDLRRGRRPRQQCRHPVRRADRGVPDREVGRRSSRSTSPSAFHAIRAAVPGMKARKWGRIINTASAHSLVASPFKSAYVAAKHGIAGLTKTVALELATFGITGNCISPGYVWTPLVEKQIPDTMKARNLTEGAGHQRRAAGGAADQAVRHGRPGRRARALPLLRRGERRSPAPTSPWTAAGPLNDRAQAQERQGRPRRLAGPRRA